MNKGMLLGGLGLASAALAVASVLLGVTLLGSGKQASANVPNAALEFSLHVGSCSTIGDEKGFCLVSNTFVASVSLDAIPGPYDAIAVTLNYSGFYINSKHNPNIVWPDCVFEGIAPPSPGFENASCAKGATAPSSTFTGTVFTATFNCPSFATGTLSLNHGPADTLLIDSANKTSTEAGPDMLNIECAHVEPTFTPTPTSTPPPIPRVFKSPVLQNVFLTRQGSKIPPATCAGGDDVALLNEQINIPVSTINPKGDVQDLAAFEFEVRFDDTKVCVNLEATAQWTAAGAICTVQDKDNSTLEGIARIGCVTIGKGVNTDGLDLATISVRPQPELFSQIRPNQDNGIPVQILNQGCELADEQGHVIPIFSCEDADITFRFLEGDVDGPDCDVDVFDTQQVAFRWGVEKGSLLFNRFMDLEPSGQVKGDGDIDIKDIQFVFGRFGSLGIAQKGSTGPCTGNPDGSDTWPPQLPVNPKA